MNGFLPGISENEGSCTTGFKRINVRSHNNERKSVYNIQNGTVIIFNHFNISKEGIEPRRGTDVDCNRLELTFTKLGFTLHTYHDLKVSEIKAKLKKFSKANYSEGACIVVIVLSHGHLNKLYAENKTYKTEMLWKYFTDKKCPSLKGKPKLFFIESCLDPPKSNNILKKFAFRRSRSYKKIYHPIHPDVLVMYSTAPGDLSYRNTVRGTWFIQSLCEIFENYAGTYDLQGLLTLVTQKVVLECDTNDNSGKIKQLPTVISTLLNIVKFNNSG